MRKINVSCNDVKGELNRYYNFCVGAGRAGELMRHVPIVQLKKVVKDCGFRYIRFHGLFHEDMGVYFVDENGKTVVSFQYIDMLFDSLLEIGIRPFVELSFMPKALASGDQTLFFWDTNVTPPADYEKWYDFIRAFTLHITERYGEEEIKKWFFEVWNEPNHPSFFSKSTDLDAYFELYKHTCLAVKSVCSDYKVGGPATAGMIWFEYMDEYCRTNNIPLDFLSGHCYCVEGDFDEDGKKDIFLKDIYGLLIHGIKKHTIMADSYGLPMHITEWSTSYSSRDPVHDTYINAAFILEAVKQLDGHADSLSYWVYTDIFEEHTPPPSPFHGGFGLVNTQSIKKPSYYSYKFLNELGDTELNCDDGATYATKTDDGAQILFWNYTRQEQNKVSNRIFYKQDIPAKPMDGASVSVTDLVNGEYEVTVQKVGYKMGDAYTEYAGGDYGMLETKEITAKLAEAAKPVSESFTVNVTDGTFAYKTETFENEIVFVTLKKI